MLSYLGANNLKKRGIAAIEAASQDHSELIVSAHGKDRYAAIDLEQYQYLRTCSLGAALPDVLAYANSKRNAAFVLGIKSHLRPEKLERLLNILEKFS